MNRLWVAAAAALLLAGCGTVGTRDGVRAQPAELEPAPSIVAVDEAAPDDVLWFLHTGQDGDLHAYCGADGGQESANADDSCPPMTPDAQAAAAEQEREWLTAVTPAPGSEPRTVAKLTLSNGDTVQFAVWHNAAGELCTDIEEESPDGSGGGGGPGGPCIPGHPNCGEVCVDSTGDGDLGDLRYVLTGFVPSGGDSVRITLRSGAAKTYPLTGPAVDGTDRRVFMVELGPQDWRRVEVFRRDRLLAAEDLPAYLAAYEDCEEKAGPMPIPNSEDDPALKAYEDALDSCLRASLPAEGG